MTWALWRNLGPHHPPPRHQKPRKTRRWWNPARVRRKFPRWRKALRPRLTRRGPLWVVGGVFCVFAVWFFKVSRIDTYWHILTLSSSSLAHVTSCPQSFTDPRALFSLQDFCMCFWLTHWPLEVASSRQHVFFHTCQERVSRFLSELTSSSSFFSSGSLGSHLRAPDPYMGTADLLLLLRQRIDTK